MPTACLELEDCPPEAPSCVLDVKFSELDLPTWFYLADGGLAGGCSWVGAAPDERCRLEGSVARVGCEGSNATLEDRDLHPDRCNYTITLDPLPASEGCGVSCGFGTCSITAVPTPRPQSQPASEAKTQQVIQGIWAYVFLLALVILFFRSLVLPWITRKPEKQPYNDDVIARAGLEREVAREQRFTIRGFDLFLNRLTTEKDADPPVRPPPVPTRPGNFAELNGVFPPRTWPGGRGADGSTVNTLLGYFLYMWRYNGTAVCVRLILYQMYLACYPSIASYYMNLIFQVATGEETRTIWHGSLRFKIIMLTVAGYFAQYIFFLWLKTTYYLYASNGRVREVMRNALLLKILRLPELYRPNPGYVAGLLFPRVDEANLCWHKGFVLCGIPAAFAVQLVLIAVSSQRSQDIYVLAAPILIGLGVISGLYRHRKQSLVTAQQKVEAHEHLFAALEYQVSKPRPDSVASIEDAHRDTETFAVANFIFRRRDALRWFVELESAAECGIFGHAVVCVSVIAASYAVLNDQMNPAELMLIIQVLQEINNTARKLARILMEVPSYVPAIVLLANFFNAEDLGIAPPERERETFFTNAAKKIQHAFRRRSSVDAGSKARRDRFGDVSLEIYEARKLREPRLVDRVRDALFFRRASTDESDGLPTSLSPMSSRTTPLSQGLRERPSPASSTRSRVPRFRLRRDEGNARYRRREVAAGVGRDPAAAKEG